MNRKNYNQLRAVVALFISMIVSFSVVQDSYVLAVVGVVTGMIFLILVRRKTKITVDEREKTVREKAAQLAYAVFAPTIGIGSFLLMVPYQRLSPVFANGEFSYLESLGMVLAYLTLFLIAVYSLAYKYYDRQYGGR